MQLPLHRTVVALLALALGFALLAAPSVAAQQPEPRPDRQGGDRTPLPVGESTAFGEMAHLTVAGEHLIRVAGDAVDPLAADLPVAPATRRLADDDVTDGSHGYWLVQSAGDLGATHARITQVVGDAGHVGFLPDSAYVVRATSAQIAELDGDDSVRWTGLYQPGWKMPSASSLLPALWELTGSQDYRVYVFRTEPDLDVVLDQVRGVAGVTELAAEGRVIDITASAEALPALTAITGVEWVESRPTQVPLNLEARWVNDTGIRDLPSAMTPGRLTGAGQTAAVADTGINYRIDEQGRANSYFSDCTADGCLAADWVQAEPGNTTDAVTGTVATGDRHRKMAAYFDIGGGGERPTDPSAHGSHVAGSVVGDTDRPGVWDRADGMAPGARLVHQNIATATGGLSSPSDEYQLFRQAYRPSDPTTVPQDWDPADYDNYDPLTDARTHNNSYGLIAPSVSLGSAEAADRFVWEHEDMVIVSSAGNSGPSVGTIGAPSIGYNVITSGASANGRQPMASIDSMAIFSSHGPTLDGRFGVDLATPGQIVTSAKGGSADEEHYLQGTSMSGPILTGLTTLVREYFWEGYGPGPGAEGVTASGVAVGDRNPARRHNPSAALVRATLINGADRMRGFYTGDEGEVRAMDGQYPSAGQGFGLVNLHNALFFDDAEGTDPTNAWYHDVWRDDDDAFGVGGGPGAIADSREYTVNVAAGEPLTVTMGFTMPPSLLGAGTPVAIANLDLQVTSPSGETYVGNNFNTRTAPDADEYFTPAGDAAPDLRNPVEKIRVPEPEAGEWTISVIGTFVPEGPQGFALAATGLLSDDGTLPFTPQPLQADVPGDPSIDEVDIDPIAADLAMVRFTTDEPTTATVTTTVEGTEVTYIDSYNVGPDGFFGLDEATVETSEAYADRPVVTTDHEVYVTGLSAGETYDLVVSATDLGGNTVSRTVTHTASAAVFQPDAPDIGQLYEDPADTAVDVLPFPLPGQAGWQDGTQIYAGALSGDGALGAFMFRMPEDLDPDRILGATVELVSGHNTTELYSDDVQFTLDLLDTGVEGNWGTQSYSAIHNAGADARAVAETGFRRGGNRTYAFSFACGDLNALRDNLATGNAPFRVEGVTASDTSAFSFEFGFNRRSKGPDLRPRLILHLDDGEGAAAYPLPDGSGAPAPVISDVGIQDGLTDGSVVVSWETDVPADSTVLYRKRGDNPFVQVGNPGRSTVHFVQLFDLDPDEDYEFAVRSTSAPGRTTTADNGGEGWNFFRETPEEVPTADFFFTGTPGDDAAKLAGSPTATFTADEPGAGPPIIQNAQPLGFPDQPGDELSAYWVGEYSGAIEGDIVFDWFWASGNPAGGAIDVEVDVTVFADPDDHADGADAIIGQREIRLTTLGAPPVRNTGRVPVSGTVDETLLIQVTPVYVDTGPALQAVYGSSTAPGSFGIPLEAPAAPEEDEDALLPAVGPVPPPSANATGFNARSVPVRNGDPTDEEIAAGTAFCGVDTAVQSVVDFDRLGGAERVETAVLVSQHAFDSADTVVLARADLFPDALAGAPLAHAEGGPILLTHSDRLVDITAAEIQRLGASEVILLGGSAALSQPIVDDLEALGVTTRRIGGPNRYATAALIADSLGGAADSVVIAEGAHADPNRGWPDPLAAAPFAAFTQRPILLVEFDRLPQETTDALQALQPSEALVVGGELAVSPSVLTGIDALGHGPRRIAGTNRYETAIAVYGEAVTAGMDPAILWLATGRNWPDALVAGPAVSQVGGTFLLIDGQDLAGSPASRDLIASLAGTLEEVVFLGGTAAVSETAENQVRGLLE